MLRCVAVPRDGGNAEACVELVQQLSCKAHVQVVVVVMVSGKQAGVHAVWAGGVRRGGGAGDVGCRFGGQCARLNATS